MNTREAIVDAAQESLTVRDEEGEGSSWDAKEMKGMKKMRKRKKKLKKDEKRQMSIYVWAKRQEAASEARYSIEETSNPTGPTLTIK